MESTSWRHRRATLVSITSKKKKEMEAYCLHDDTSNLVRVSVRSWTTILKVSLAVLGTLARNTNGTATVSDTIRKLVDRTGLVTAGETFLVALAVHGNVLDVARLELLHGRLDGLHAAVGTGASGRHVGVQTRAVPVAGDRLGVERDLGAKLFGDTVQQETRNPQVVAHLDALAGADLVLPLGRHDLGVDTRNVDAGVHAGLVVRLDNVAAVDLAGADAAVVRALGTGEAALGPAVWPAVRTQQRVFLLETEPEVLGGVSVHQLVGLVAVVELVGGAIGVPGLAQDQDVLAGAEGVGVDGDRADVDVGVVAGGLAGGRAVKVPLGELVDRGDSFREGLQTTS